jgi:hypothetical protein
MERRLAICHLQNKSRRAMISRQWMITQKPSDLPRLTEHR